MDWLTIVLILVVGSVLVIGFLGILTIAAFFFGRKEIQKRIFKFLKPNPQDIERDIERLHLKYPNFSPDEMASVYVKDQAKFLALAAFITEIPLLGTVIDISFTTLRQMRMLHVITALYGNDKLDPEELEVKYMALVGGTSFLGRALIKGFTGEILFLSGFINCGLNWFITNRIGEIAIGWNKEQSIWTTTKGTLNNTKQKALNVKDEAFNKVNSALRGGSQVSTNMNPSPNLQIGQEEIFAANHKGQ